MHQLDRLAIAFIEEAMSQFVIRKQNESVGATHLFEINNDFPNLIVRADLMDFNKMRTNQSFRIRLLSWL